MEYGRAEEISEVVAVEMAAAQPRQVAAAEVAEVAVAHLAEVAVAHLLGSPHLGPTPWHLPMCRTTKATTWANRRAQGQ